MNILENVICKFKEQAPPTDMANAYGVAEKEYLDFYDNTAGQVIESAVSGLVSSGKITAEEKELYLSRTQGAAKRITGMILDPLQIFWSTKINAPENVNENFIAEKEEILRLRHEEYVPKLSNHIEITKWTSQSLQDEISQDEGRHQSEGNHNYRNDNLRRLRDINELVSASIITPTV